MNFYTEIRETFDWIMPWVELCRRFSFPSRPSPPQPPRQSKSFRYSSAQKPPPMSLSRMLVLPIAEKKIYQISNYLNSWNLRFCLRFENFELEMEMDLEFIDAKIVNRSELINVDYIFAEQFHFVAKPFHSLPLEFLVPSKHLRF